MSGIRIVKIIQPSTTTTINRRLRKYTGGKVLSFEVAKFGVEVKVVSSSGELGINLARLRVTRCP
jgi:hypothetical protein